LTCAGETRVLAGTLSGSVVQDDDVVTPPVELSDTEHGIPGKSSAGFDRPVLRDDVPDGGDVPDGSVEDGRAPGAGAPDCANAGSVVSHSVVVMMNSGFIALSRRKGVSRLKPAVAPGVPIPIGSSGQISAKSGPGHLASPRK
jgi:hypothetical protein